MSLFEYYQKGVKTNIWVHENLYFVRFISNIIITFIFDNAILCTFIRWTLLMIKLSKFPYTTNKCVLKVQAIILEVVILSVFILYVIAFSKRPHHRNDVISVMNSFKDYEIAILCLQAYFDFSSLFAFIYLARFFKRLLDSEYPTSNRATVRINASMLKQQKAIVGTI